MVPRVAATKDQTGHKRGGDWHRNDKARQKGGPVTCANGKVSEGGDAGQVG